MSNPVRGHGLRCLQRRLNNKPVDPVHLHLTFVVLMAVLCIGHAAATHPQSEERLLNAQTVGAEERNPLEFY